MRERALVPDADFESYYGRPVLKRPTWKSPDVPLYLFLGGYAGVSALLAEGAAATGRAGLERVTRVGAAVGVAGGTVALIHDLGRPERFLNMLRVFKVTSPLSVGSWILAPFGGLAAGAAASNVTGLLPVLGRACGAGAAALGAPLATYTGALLANTAVPAWHDAHRELPFLFAGSAATAAGGVAIALSPLGEAEPARRLALAGTAVELFTEERLKRRLGPVAEPYTTGRPAKLLNTAVALSAAGTLGAFVGRRSRTLSVLSGLALTVSSLLTRFGIFEAGLASAEDPKYTVQPQRERLQARTGQPG